MSKSKYSNIIDGGIFSPSSNTSINYNSSKNMTEFSDLQSKNSVNTSNSNISNLTNIDTPSHKNKHTTYEEKTPYTYTSSIKNNDGKDYSQTKIDFSMFKALEISLEKKAESIEVSLLTKQNEALESLRNSLKTSLTDIDQHKSEMKDELKDTRNSVLGTIALFAAFFTFVSVNVNIFTKAENVIHSVVFMLCFWLCIIGFISLFFLFLNKKQDSDIFKSIEFSATVFCVISSAVLIYILYSKSEVDSYKKIDEKISKIQKENLELKKENSELKNKLQQDIESLDRDIFELRRYQKSEN